MLCTFLAKLVIGDASIQVTISIAQAVARYIVQFI